MRTNRSVSCMSKQQVHLQTRASPHQQFAVATIRTLTEAADGWRAPPQSPQQQQLDLSQLQLRHEQGERQRLAVAAAELARLCERDYLLAQSSCRW